MKTTSDCKKFLVDFFKQTPNLIIQLYDIEEGQMAYSFALDVKNWKRATKCKPLSDASYIHGPTTEIWEKGKDYPKGPGYHAGIPLETSKIAVERHFVLKEDELGTGVIFMVLETHDGELYLGEYIGD
jgi:hypothetical protein